MRMSKRFSSNNHYGENKKAKLNISMSDHHLPLSQNSNKENDFDNWGDDNDDEMLLQASQACEQAISCDTSMLPEYSMWEPPGSTSTQCQPAPSTSKAPFTFKKPSGTLPSAISTHLKNKCSTISSPLPGMANKFVPHSNGFANLTDDLVINGRGMPGQDIYNEVLRLKEQKDKLMADIDRLQQKCVTKEGEASILRTQLKTCQKAADAARMEKARAQEDVKKEFQSKLDTYESQMANLETQLEFKNLEIISVKEKCKNLESGKRMTQVIVPSHDILSSSYRNNMSISAPHEPAHTRRPHTTSSVQTEDNTPFVKLKKTQRKDISNISDVIPHILEPTQAPHSMLNYNENLQKHSEFYQNRSNVISSWDKVPSTAGPVGSKVVVQDVVEDLVYFVEYGQQKDAQNHFNHLFGALQRSLSEVQQDLTVIRQRASVAFLREMDDAYIDSTSHYQVVEITQLLQGQQLYPKEQGVVARRLLAACAVALESPDALAHLEHFQETTGTSLVDSAVEICDLIADCSVGVLYSGVLLSLSCLLETLPVDARVVSSVSRARGRPSVAARVLRLARRVPGLCGGRAADLRMDHDQGLQLYTKDSCSLQVLLSAVEVALKCIEKQRLRQQAFTAMEDLVSLHRSLGDKYRNLEDNRCECQAMLVQRLVYSLQICASMLEEEYIQKGWAGRRVRCMWAQCRACVASVAAVPTGGAGRLAAAGLALRRLPLDSEMDNMLSELTSTFQVAMEDTPVSYLPDPWRISTEDFDMAD